MPEEGYSRDAILSSTTAGSEANLDVHPSAARQRAARRIDFEYLDGVGSAKQQHGSKG